ncbi:O-methyltransferase, partial [bacterium]|nr:O-methyltransferase [bacterium]
VIIIVMGLGVQLFLQDSFTRAQSLEGSNQLPPEMDIFLQELEDFNRSQRMLNVPRTDGIFLRMMAELVQAKNALEIGTSNGYSSIWIGLGLKATGGKLTTLEIEPEKVKMARENFRKAKLDDRITVIEGDALKTLPKLKGKFDYVFIDAWKPDYYKYFTMVYPKLNKGGVIIAHNAISSSRAMKKYLDTVKNHPDLETVISRP